MDRYISIDNAIKIAIKELSGGEYDALVNVTNALKEALVADVVPRERYDRVMENLKAVLAERAEGEWEKRNFIILDFEKIVYRCTVCNTTWDAPTKYCPNCGAKMKAGDV